MAPSIRGLRAVATNSSMSWRSACAGASLRCGSCAFVTGLVSCAWSHCAMAARSYACPSAVVTGSSITSPVIGQRYCGGTGAGGTGSPATAGAPPTDVLRRRPRRGARPRARRRRERAASFRRATSAAPAPRAPYRKHSGFASGTIARRRSCRRARSRRGRRRCAMSMGGGAVALGARTGGTSVAPLASPRPRPSSTSRGGGRVPISTMRAVLSAD